MSLSPETPDHSVQESHGAFDGRDEEARSAALLESHQDELQGDVSEGIDPVMSSIAQEHDEHGALKGQMETPYNDSEGLDGPVATPGHSPSRKARENHDEVYLDPTPITPRLSASPSRHAHQKFAGQPENEPALEIQSIMEQFREDEREMQREDTHSEAEGEISLQVPVKHPPRRSSLEPSGDIRPLKQERDTIDKNMSGHDEILAPSPGEKVIAETPRRASSMPLTKRLSNVDTNPQASPHSAISLPTEPPLVPDPEPDLPFDFHRFLEQLRHRTADPVAKYLRSFLSEFGKKQWMAHEQEKFVADFLTFIANKMAQCEVWRGISDAEFDNAKEGMEKLVMNRLYSQTFSPAIPLPIPTVNTRGKKKSMERLLGTGRRGQHQEDIERDDILNQKVRIYGWVEEEHLDIGPVGTNGRRLLDLAQQELLKIKSYRAPRDKVICVLNCCKVIFGLLRNSKSSDTSADAFVPLLIYVVLHANPEHLVSNVQYIVRFRNPDKLGGEAGYYLSSLMGAIQFVEKLDRTSLTILDDEFEKKVEAAVSTIAEGHREAPLSPQRPARQPSQVQISEKSGISQPEVVSRNSIEAEYSSPSRSTSTRARPSALTAADGSEENTAVNGLLRTIQRPLTSLGRMFAEEIEGSPDGGPLNPNPPPQPPRRLSPALFQPPRHSEEAERPDVLPSPRPKQHNQHKNKPHAEDAAARQASAEAAEAERVQRAEHQNVVETLAGMFPNLDKDVIDDVVRMKQGRVGLAVDACLALNA